MKISVISALPLPIDVSSLRSYPGYAGYYRRFMKDFSKTASPLNELLCKKIKFEMNEAQIKAFQTLKDKLVSAPILQSPDWELPFVLTF